MWFQHFFVALTIGMLSSYFFKCCSAYFINVLNKIIICSLYAWGLHFYTFEIFWDWSFWTVVLEKTPESPLDCKDIKSVYLKGNQPLIFIGRTDAEAEAPILWTPDAKRWLTGKDPGGGKDWGQEKGAAEDEMVGWHHQLQWSWIWANSRRQWRTGKPSMLYSPGAHRVEHNLATEQQQRFGAWRMSGRKGYSSSGEFFFNIYLLFGCVGS